MEFKMKTISALFVSGLFYGYGQNAQADIVFKGLDDVDNVLVIDSNIKNNVVNKTQSVKDDIFIDYVQRTKNNLIKVENNELVENLNSNEEIIIANSFNKKKKINDLEVKKDIVLYKNVDLNDNYINDVKIYGLKNIPQIKILEIINVHKKSPINNDGLLIIKNKLMHSGLFESVFVEISESNLILNLVENPLIKKINVSGAKKIKSKNIIDNMNKNNIGENSIMNPVIISEFLSSLKSEYINMGNEQVQIQTYINKINEREINFNIHVKEGLTTKINDIKFLGINKYSSSKLKRMMDNTNESGFLTKISQGNKLNHANLEYDLNKVLDFYQNNGYFESRIENIDMPTVNNHSNLKDVNVNLHEGEIYKFDKPEIRFSDENALILFNKSSKNLITVLDGNIFKKDDVLKTKENINNYFANNGFAFNQVDISVVSDSHNKKVKFIYDVNLGSDDKVKIDNINVYGNKKTKTDVIKKELRQKEGDFFDLSKLQRSKERLDLTGYFDNVELKTLKNNNGNIDLNINLKERRTGTVQANIGYMQDYGVSLGAAAEDRNFMGSGKSLGGSVNYNKINKSASVNYSNPYFTDSGISMDTSIFGSIYDPRKQKDNYQSYKTSKYGLGLNWGFPINEYNKIYAGLFTERLNLNTYDNAPKKYREFIAENSNNINGIGKFKGTIIKGTLGWGQNTTNHAYWPTSGHISNVNAEITIPKVSKIDFYKLNVEHKQFIPVGDKSSLMLSAKAGYANSYGETKNLPFFENYYAGGLGSIRGYETGTLGPKVYDKDNNVITYGGNKMVGFTAEFNTPIPFVKDNTNVRLGAFVDASSVWDGKKYSDKESDNAKSVYGKTYHSSFKNELRTSAGLAYTWLSPIGVIKFSYAIPLNKKKEDQLQRFQFQLGTTF